MCSSLTSENQIHGGAVYTDTAITRFPGPADGKLRGHEALHLLSQHRCAYRVRIALNLKGVPYEASPCTCARERTGRLNTSH